MNFNDYLSKVSPGESVLIEHTSLSMHALAFYAIGEKYGWDRVLLVDVIDSSVPAVRWLRLSGLSVPENVTRIKAGGVSDWGNIILEIDPHKDPGIFLSKFSRKIREVYSKSDFTVTVIMNPERLVPLQNGNRNFILMLSNMASAFLGNPRRITFYFVNREMTEGIYLALLEEAFTRVLCFTGKRNLRVLKSPEMEEEGIELNLGFKKQV
ncbi:DUF257 family protein [Thermococcus nautili]|uniref:RecA-superfamily ATPases implicated in signal transduction n=1 Tax=Thermococcus nautili TaxID=195522 RepID=W8NUW6_9EURY|nr:DUF257 family protein [Thermococcus nautili]AHL22967.1 hypothetical protein BD01_1356 [Thermococcus nautili]